MFLAAIGKDSFSGPLLPNPQSGLSFLPRELGHSHPPSLSLPPPPAKSLGLGVSAPSTKPALTGPGRAGATGPTVGSIRTGHTPDSLRLLQETVAGPTPSEHLCALGPSPVPLVPARPGPPGGSHTVADRAQDSAAPRRGRARAASASGRKAKVCRQRVPYDPSTRSANPS